MTIEIDSPALLGDRSTWCERRHRDPDLGAPYLRFLIDGDGRLHPALPGEVFRGWVNDQIELFAVRCPFVFGITSGLVGIRGDESFDDVILPQPETLLGLRRRERAQHGEGRLEREVESVVRPEHL